MDFVGIKASAAIPTAAVAMPAAAVAVLVLVPEVEVRLRLFLVVVDESFWGRSIVDVLRSEPFEVSVLVEVLLLGVEVEWVCFGSFTMRLCSAQSVN